MPKVNPNYPDTSTRGPEMPLHVLIRKVDKNFDRDRQRDLAYRFRERRFYERPSDHGAYLVAPDFSSDFEDDFNTLEAVAHAQNGWEPGPDTMEGAVFDGGVTPSPPTPPDLPPGDKDFSPDFSPDFNAYTDGMHDPFDEDGIVYNGIYPWD